MRNRARTHFQGKFPRSLSRSNSFVKTFAVRQCTSTYKGWFYYSFPLALFKFPLSPTCGKKNASTYPSPKWKLLFQWLLLVYVACTYVVLYWKSLLACVSSFCSTLSEMANDIATVLQHFDKDLRLSTDFCQSRIGFHRSKISQIFRDMTTHSEFSLFHCL